MRLRQILAILTMVMMSATSANAAEPILIRFSHVVAEDTPKGVGARMFKDLAEKKFPGRVTVEVYPASQRFDDDQVLDALLLGDVEMAAPSLAKFNRWAKPLQVFDLPFLFRDVDHLHRFQEGVVGTQLLQTMLPMGLQGIAYWDGGFRVLSANVPLSTPADAEALVFRIEPSDVFQEQYSRINAVGIPMAFGRVADAVRQGVVNAQENSWSNIYAEGIHKLHSNYTELNHSYLGYMVVTSSDFWQGLPEDIRTGLEEVLLQVRAEVNRLAAERAEERRDRVVAEGGVAIMRPDAKKLQAWKDAWLPVWENFETEIGPEVIEAAIAAGSEQ
ncbi:MAG: DctP family TRAP transporter solute-binding subunit [Rhodospirillales bacterium]|nr:DctP family TRAP transporter solute-binding subunit [Rhodospirillales bacterium]